MRIRNRVREYREQSGKSLRQVADDLGLDYSNLARIERQERGTTPERMQLLAAYFNVPVATLFLLEPVSKLATAAEAAR